jgi:hypothetical protein
MVSVDRRRANIEALIKTTQKMVSLRGKIVRTVDPLFICANRLYPYLPEGTLLEYARTALKIITNQERAIHPSTQTTLLFHFA